MFYDWTHQNSFQQFNHFQIKLLQISFPVAFPPEYLDNVFILLTYSGRVYYLNKSIAALLALLQTRSRINIL